MLKVVSPPSKTPEPKPFTWQFWALSTELGFKIAMPLVIGILAGIKLDKNFGTLPLITIIATLVAMTLSTYLIYRDFKRLQKKFEQS